MKQGTSSIGAWNAAVVARFAQKFDERDSDECWPWTASLNAKGYGQFFCSIRKRPIPASRFALELHLGRPLRDGHYALHHCDNPPCVNPAHLYEGTLSQNTQDMLARGGFRNGKGQSFNVGSKNGNAKLDDDKVRAIRASDADLTSLADTFGVCEDSIRLILKRKTWRHVS